MPERNISLSRGGGGVAGGGHLGALRPQVCDVFWPDQVELWISTNLIGYLDFGKAPTSPPPPPEVYPCPSAWPRHHPIHHDVLQHVVVATQVVRTSAVTRNGAGSYAAPTTQANCFGSPNPTSRNFRSRVNSDKPATWPMNQQPRLGFWLSGVAQDEDSNAL